MVYSFLLPFLGQRIFPVGGERDLKCMSYLCAMKPDKLLRAILPEVLIDNFDIDRFEKATHASIYGLTRRRSNFAKTSTIKTSYPTVLEITTPYRIILYVDVQRTSMCVSASGWTKPPARYSAMSGTYPSSTARGLTPSSSLF